MSAPRAQLPSLRRALLSRLAAVAFAQLVLLAAVVALVFQPRLDALLAEQGEELARGLARSATEILLGPAELVSSATKRLDAGRPGLPAGAIEQEILEVIAGSSPAIESAFLLDARGTLQRIASTTATGAPIASRIGLDLARSPIWVEGQRADQVFSTPYLSSISDRLLVAVSARRASGGLLVAEFDLQRLSQLLNSAAAQSRASALIIDARGQVIAHPDPVRARQNVQLGVADMTALASGPRPVIDFDGQRMRASIVPVNTDYFDWRVVVMQPLSEAHTSIDLILLLLGSALAIAVAVFLVSVSLARKLSAGAEVLAGQADQLSEGGQVTAEPMSFEEFDHLQVRMHEMAATLSERQAALQKLNEELEARVHARTATLEQANAELGQAMVQLRATQAELVQAGKLAALGALVAGVAHELNTPIGNARLVSSTLSHEVVQLQQMLEASTVSRQALRDTSAAIGEAAAVVERSLARAGDLVTSFKQVAVDQMTTQRRRFPLLEVIREMELLLAAKLRQGGFTLVVEASVDPVLDSYPGPLGQVLANLIENAAVHAFDPGHGGQIRILASEPDAQHVRIDVEDNGRGIATADLDRIFDPFFTTRLGQGGTGLGLSIVWNMTRDVLGGSISVRSTVGTGSTFSVVIPRVAPRDEQANAPATSATASPVAGTV